MNALYGRTPRGTPRPPKHIEREMFEAGKAHDQLRLNVAAAAYRAWLRDRGYADGPHGSEAPDKAWQ